MAPRSFSASAESFSWEELEQGAGLPRAAMREFAERLHRAKTAVLIWSMGITQHPYGADGVQMMLNLALTQGWVGRDKCGVMPIRGHSSVQGGAEMGCYSTALPGPKAITPENCAELGAALRLPDSRLAGPHQRGDGGSLRPRRARCALLPRRQFSAHAARSGVRGAARWQMCRCACTRTSSSPTRC